VVLISFYRMVYDTFGRAAGSSLDNYAPFERVFRRVAGRRNLYNIHILVGVLLVLRQGGHPPPRARRHGAGIQPRVGARPRGSRTCCVASEARRPGRRRGASSRPPDGRPTSGRTRILRRLPEVEVHDFEHRQAQDKIRDREAGLQDVRVRPCGLRCPPCTRPKGVPRELGQRPDSVYSNASRSVSAAESAEWAST